MGKGAFRMRGKDRLFVNTHRTPSACAFYLTASALAQAGTQTGLSVNIYCISSVKGQGGFTELNKEPHAQALYISNKTLPVSL
jgi:hypothetical protein